MFSNNSFLQFLQYFVSYCQNVVNFDCKFEEPVLVLLKQSSFVFIFSSCDIVSLAKSISSAVVFFQSIYNLKLVFSQLLQLSNLLQYQLLSRCKVRQVFIVYKDLKQQAAVGVDLLVFQSFYYYEQFLVVYVVPFFYSTKLPRIVSYQVLFSVIFLQLYSFYCQVRCVYLKPRQFSRSKYSQYQLFNIQLL